jgi:hypothetical protein
MAKGQARSTREKKKPKKSSGEKVKAPTARSAYQQAMKPKS